MTIPVTVSELDDSVRHVLVKILIRRSTVESLTTGNHL